MHSLRYLTILTLAAMLASACGSTANSPITPAADRLTFLFFYTEN